MAAWRDVDPDDQPSFERIRREVGNGAASATNKGKVKRALKFARIPYSRHGSRRAK